VDYETGKEPPEFLKGRLARRYKERGEDVPESLKKRSKSAQKDTDAFDPFSDRVYGTAARGGDLADVD